MNETAAKALVGRTGWLAAQPAWLRDAVLAGSRLRSYEADQFTFHAGDEPGGMYGVVDGGVGILVPSGGQDLALCHVMRRGTWFGYGPVLSVGGRRKMTFKALEKSHLLHLPLRELTAIGTGRPEFFRSLAALHDMTFMMSAVRVVGDLLIRSGEKRIAAVLARIAKREPDEADQQPWPVRLSQADIGLMSNSSRDRVNRALAKFVKAGWITTDFKLIVINDLTALERFSRQG